MPISRLFRSWMRYQMEQSFYFDGVTPNPDKVKFYTLLCNGNLGDTSGKEAIFSSEIVANASNNYSRFNALFSGPPTYDGANRRWQMPPLSWSRSFGQAIQYNALVLVANASPNANTPVTVTPGSPATFATTSNHFVAVGEEVLFTVDDTGSVPTGMTQQSIYYVSEVISATSFRVSSTKNGTSVNVSNAGSGFRLRYCAGILVGLRTEDSLITIPTGAVKSWDFFLTEANYYGIGTGS